MNFKEKKRLGLVDDDGNSKNLGNTDTNGPLKRSGAFTKKMGMAAPAQKTLPSAVGSNPGATGNMSNAMGEETVEFLTQQHGLTQKLLEEKFANMMEKFNHMRPENELQREKLLNEQRKTTKVALAGAMAAKKASNAIPASHIRNQSEVGGNKHSSTGSNQSQQQEQEEGASNQSKEKVKKKKNCCRRLYEWADKHENMLLGAAFIFGLLVLMVISF